MDQIHQSTQAPQKKIFFGMELKVDNSIYNKTINKIVKIKKIFIIIDNIYLSNLEHFTVKNQKLYVVLNFNILLVQIKML